MYKAFSLSNNKAMINFSSYYCDSYEKVLDSEGFCKVLSSYLSKAKNANTKTYRFISGKLDTDDLTIINKEVISLFKLLSVMNLDEIIKINEKYNTFSNYKDELIDFVEDLYRYWRKIERYTLIFNNKITEGLEKTRFIEANQDFSNLILSLYRKVEENILQITPNVYRQLPAGGNAGLVLSNNDWKIPPLYEPLKNIPFIENILLDPPFIVYPKKNKREGTFKEVFENPIKDCKITTRHWFCFPAKVGDLLAYIYFHRDFMSHGISLCNLFEIAKKEEYQGKKPDIVYVFGARCNFNETKTVFYNDNENDIMLGLVSYSDEIDYFGYMKKMTLTLHNLIMLKRGYLPLHGAMANITLKNGKQANVILIGDSGAGKSETLEAIRNLKANFVSELSIIFDDMGTIRLNNGEVLAYGTEIGAFVRLDDLDQGYAFKEMDRSIFMNPDKTNARLIIPVSSYKEIIKGHKVDLFLYANNYDRVEDGNSIELFTDVDKAIGVFKSGNRLAKGTTNEVGLVSSYFANPFGPLQWQDRSDELIEIYFKALFDKGIKVGQIKTQLGINCLEKEGPTIAAKALFELINNL